VKIERTIYFCTEESALLKTLVILIGENAAIAVNMTIQINFIYLQEITQDIGRVQKNTWRPGKIDGLNDIVNKYLTFA